MAILLSLCMTAFPGIAGASGNVEDIWYDTPKAEDVKPPIVNGGEALKGPAVPLGKSLPGSELEGLPTMSRKKSGCTGTGMLFPELTHPVLKDRTSSETGISQSSDAECQRATWRGEDDARDQSRSVTRLPCCCLGCAGFGVGALAGFYWYAATNLGSANSEGAKVAGLIGGVVGELLASGLAQIIQPFESRHPPDDSKLAHCYEKGYVTQAKNDNSFAAMVGCIPGVIWILLIVTTNFGGR